MGAWGEGMLANDAALDAISRHEAELRLIVLSRASPAALLQKLSENEDPEHRELLGVAQVLVRKQVVLDEAIKKLLSACIVEALTCVHRWREPKQRVNALTAFALHLEGVIPSQDDEADEFGNYWHVADEFKTLQELAN